MYITYIYVYIFLNINTESYINIIYIFIYMHVRTINEKGNHKFERVSRVMWEGLEGGKGGRK